LEEIKDKLEIFKEEFKNWESFKKAENLGILIIYNTISQSCKQELGTVQNMNFKEIWIRLKKLYN
jgi:hypothetical protein